METAHDDHNYAKTRRVNLNPQYGNIKFRRAGHANDDGVFLIRAWDDL